MIIYKQAYLFLFLGKKITFMLEARKCERKGDGVFYGLALSELNNMVLTRASYLNHILELQRKDDGFGKCRQIVVLVSLLLRFDKSIHY